MRALVVGDSMIKYLNQYLYDDSVDFYLDIVSYPGATVESLARKISVLKSKYDWVLVHVGTNNASLDSVKVMLRKYRSLASEILLCKPDARIIFSGVVPRTFNRFREDCRKTEHSLKILNCKIEAINNALKQLCFDQEAFFFCSSCKISWDGYLGQDGLRPNRRGNRLLFDCFSRCLKDLISAEIPSKKIKKCQLINTRYLLDLTAFPPLSSDPPTLAVSAWPALPSTLLRRASAKPISRPAHAPARSVSRPAQTPARPVSQPKQDSSHLLSLPWTVPFYPADSSNLKKNSIGVRIITSM